MNNKYIGIPLLLLVVYVALPALLQGHNYIYSLVISSLVIAGIATAWALLSNLGGMLSFGHAAFFGVGAYASALLSMQLGMPVLLSMLIAAVITAIISVSMLPTLRLSGVYFALAILAYASIFRIIATEWRSLTGGAGGITGVPKLPHVWGLDLSSYLGSYLLILTLVVMFVALYYVIGKSNHGLALKAMHDSEVVTRVLGVNSTWLKALMLLLSAFMTGLVGAFMVHYINFLEPSYAFSSNWTLLPIIAAICGGYRSVIGPVVGAVGVYLLDQLLFKSLLPVGHQVILGAVLVAVIMYRPSGIAGLFLGFRRRRDHA